MKVLQQKATILSNEQICERLYCLGFEAPHIIKHAKPGQFVHVRISDGLAPFFRRPFSVARIGTQAEIIYEVVGDGTAKLAAKKPGELIDIIGPVGKEFDLPPAGVTRVVMIGGGVGIAPLIFLADRLREKKYEVTFLYGARSTGHVFDMEQLTRAGCEVCLSTDDGSVGVRGKVSVLFERVVWDAKTTYIYTCGPRPMMKAVQAFAREKGVRGACSLEEVMACGTGTCLGCATKTVTGYKTVCHDGPVFGLDEVVFG